MDPLTYRDLTSNPELLTFVRHNPIWYRYLSRDSHQIHELPNAAKDFYGYTFAQRLEKINHQIQMVGMLMKFTEVMKD